MVAPIPTTEFCNTTLLPIFTPSITNTLFNLVLSPSATFFPIVDDFVCTFSPIEHPDIKIELYFVDSLAPLATSEDDMALSSLSVRDVISLHPYSRDGNVHARRVTDDASLERT